MGNFIFEIRDKKSLLLTCRNVSKAEFSECEKEVIFSLIRCSMYFLKELVISTRDSYEEDSICLNIHSKDSDVYFGIGDKIFRSLKLNKREKVASIHDIESEVLKVFPDFKL